MAQNFLSDIKLGDSIYIRLGDRGPASGGGEPSGGARGTNGATNTGGGGGGQNGPGGPTAGTGGSGVVVLRYKFQN